MTSTLGTLAAACTACLEKSAGATAAPASAKAQAVVKPKARAGHQGDLVFKGQVHRKTVPSLVPPHTYFSRFILGDRWPPTHTAVRAVGQRARTRLSRK